MKRQRLTSEQWSQYWRGDSVTTFARQFNANYDGEFAAFWDRQFEDLTGGARVVDLATGNGAIALLAAKFAARRERVFRILGLDYARIDPAEALASHADLVPLLRSIEFRGGARIEATELANDSVDLLTSQYGFEYADHCKATKEARRILKKGASIALIMHHENSEIVKLAMDGLKQARYCIREERLDARVIALIRAMGSATTLAERRRLRMSERAEKLRKKLNAAVARINARVERYRDPEGFIGVIIPNLLNVFLLHKDATLEAKLSYVRRVRDDIVSFENRMMDLQLAALSQDRFQAIVDELRNGGFRIRDEDQIHYGPKRDLMGWALVAEKR